MSVYPVCTLISCSTPAMSAAPRAISCTRAYTSFTPSRRESRTQVKTRA